MKLDMVMVQFKLNIPDYFYDDLLVPKGENNYLTFDSSKPSGKRVKSKIITKEHKLFSTYLLLTLGLMAC